MLVQISLANGFGCGTYYWREEENWCKKKHKKIVKERQKENLLFFVDTLKMRDCHADKADRYFLPFKPINGMNQTRHTYFIPEIESFERFFSLLFNFHFNDINKIYLQLKLFFFLLIFNKEKVSLMSLCTVLLPYLTSAIWSETGKINNTLMAFEIS